MECDEIRLKRLGKKCARALALYTDLAETICEVMIQSAEAPISPADRSRLLKLRRQEMVALRMYLQARLELMTALSLEPFPAYRRILTAVRAPDPAGRNRPR
jgi:hypothetical protein